MPRIPRIDMAGHVYHVINRANARLAMFEKHDDFAAFERIMKLAQDRTNMRLLAWCLMPNHWHMVLWPRKDGDLARFTGWLTLTHTQRWHAHHHTTGQGHLYQGRYKSFLVESEHCLTTVCRYVERNALRAHLVKAAEDWQWGSLYAWLNRSRQGDDLPQPDDWPTPGGVRPRNWRQLVNQPQSQEELESLRLCISRSRPYGPESWVKQMAKQHGLTTTIRPRGRPRLEKGP